MAIVTRKNVLNLQPGLSAPVVVHVSQGDQGYPLTFYLVNGDEQYLIPYNVTITVAGSRIDGSHFGPYACTFADDKVTFTMKSEISRIAGSGIAEITITNSAHETVGSANFVFMVEECTIPNGVTYSNDASVYEEILSYTKAQMSILQAAIGAPEKADTSSEMTNHNKVYIYTGDQAGYTYGHWYYWNGSAWTDGGIYNAMAIATDTTLSVAGEAADAEATGLAIAKIGYNFPEQTLRVEMLENGMLVNGTGHERNSSQRVRCTFAPCKAGTVISSTLVSFNVWEYDTATKLYIRDNGGWTRSYTVQNDCYVRIMWQNTNDQYSFADLVNATNFQYEAVAGYVSDPYTTLEAVATEKSVNMFNENTPWENGTYNNNGYAGSTSPTYAAVRPTCGVTAGVQYTVSWGDSAYTGEIHLYVHQIRADGTRISYALQNFGVHKYTFKAASECVKLGFHIYAPDCTDWTELPVDWIQVESGYTPSDYTASYVIPYKALNKSALFKDVTSKIIDHQLSTTVRTIAHRGDDIIAPQCTKPSYMRARLNGNEWAENDLTMSEDGQLCMWHDTSLTRLETLQDVEGYLLYTDGDTYYWVKNNAAYTYVDGVYITAGVSVSALTQCEAADYGVNSDYDKIGLNWDILSRLDFGAYRGNAFAGTHILTFGEWVLLCKQLGMGIYIDRKLTYTNAIIQQAAGIVKRYGMSNHACWFGLSGEQITYLRTIIPTARCGVLAYPTAANMTTYGPYNWPDTGNGTGFFFSGDVKELDNEAVIAGLEAGFDVEGYYVDYPADIKDTIFTNIRAAVNSGMTGLTLDHYKVNDAFKYMIQ